MRTIRKLQDKNKWSSENFEGISVETSEKFDM